MLSGGTRVLACAESDVTAFATHAESTLAPHLHPLWSQVGGAPTHSVEQEEALLHSRCRTAAERGAERNTGRQITGRSAGKPQTCPALDGRRWMGSDTTGSCAAGRCWVLKRSSMTIRKAVHTRHTSGTTATRVPRSIRTLTNESRLSSEPTSPN